MAPSCAAARKNSFGVRVQVLSSSLRLFTSVSVPSAFCLGAYSTLVPPASTSRVMLSMVRPAWLASTRVACTTLLSMAVICSTSVSGVQPPYWCRSLVMVVTFRA